MDLASIMKGDLEGQHLDGIRGPVICGTCQVGVNEVLHAIENGTDPIAIANMIVNVCVDLGFGSQVFCENFIMIAEVTCAG